MKHPLCKSLALIAAFIVFGTSPAHAADEAEFQVWAFTGPTLSWNGNGPLKFGMWPVRENMMRLPVPSNGIVMFGKNELMLPADKVNVIQVRADAGSATRCQIAFTTGISPIANNQKMVEFDLKPGAGIQDYTVDLKSLSTWQDSVVSLRISFLSAKEGEELSVEHVKAFVGDKISKPMIYAAFREGQKHEPKEFRLGALFNDKMVLQRGKALPVWGRAKAGEKVTVEFAGQTKTAVADSAGKWQVSLDSMEAAAEGRSLVASGDVAGHRIELKEVVVGDIWLCGGQSNMGGSPAENLPPEERRQELLETDYPNLRYVSMPAMHRDKPATNDLSEDSLEWRSIGKSGKGVSAVGYFLGQAIHASQKVPVGLLFIIKAGSQIEQWMDEPTLASIFTPEELSQTCGKTHLASGLFNGMVAPIPPFPVRGSMWYQGESNADNEFKYMGYYKSLPAMMKMWRSYWGSDLPVLIVQLPRFEGYPPGSWAHIREVQSLCASQLPKVGVAVTFDEGDPKNLHPANKYFVGTRLGLLARAIAYGEKVDAFSPSYKSVEIKGNSVEVAFEHAGKGLQAKGDLTGFEVRAKGGEWVTATAKIVGVDRIAVSSEAVSAPEAVRYGWGNSIPATLFNDAGLPASPFRSDTPSELIEQVKKSGL